MILKGKFRFSVTEQEVAHGSIKGHYTVEMQDMREPLSVLWQAQNGKVRNPGARSTEIAFDLSGARAGHLWTTVITVQMTDTKTCDVIIEGVFVQIRVREA